jgi:hypothetical protein
MKKHLLVIVVPLLLLMQDAYGEEGKPGVTFDLTYMSKWLSKGAEAYGQQGALFKTIDLDFGNGFGMKVTHRNATASGYVDRERFDYRPYYKGQLFDGEPYLTNYNISFGYEHYPGLARNRSNTTFEWTFGFSWPKILSEHLVPSYIAHYEYPAGSNYDFAFITGWVHRFLLTYDFSMSELSADLPDQTVYFSSEVAYADGLGGAAHDWSYATFGLSTNLKLSERLSFIPGFYYQISMDDSVSGRDDITYAKLSMRYKF